METRSAHPDRRAAHHPDQFQHGVKGIAYDWRAVVAEVAARRLDDELAALHPTPTAP